MIRIIQGDCRNVLRTLPSESVHCVVTSPPYWALRSYLADCDPLKPLEIGLEANFSEYIATMIDVFRDVRRLLCTDGTCWINLGDCYATGAGAVGARPGGGAQGDAWAGFRGDRVGAEGKHAYMGERGIGPMTSPNRMPQLGLKPKDLVGIPWRVAFALQADGWWLRQDIIYSKPNPMPESVTDRCTKAHEYIFMLTKSKRYYFDQESILEDCSPSTHDRLSQDVQNQIGSKRANGATRSDRPMNAVARRGGSNRAHKYTEAYEGGQAEHRTKAGLVAFSEKQRKLAEAGSGIKNNDSFDQAMAIMPVKRNKRSVWTVGSEPFSEAHFATFPPALIEPCIKAGCPEGGTVLDPFGGAGTTGLVADRLRRDAILIELNPEYATMAANRIRNDGGMLCDVRIEQSSTLVAAE